MLHIWNEYSELEGTHSFLSPSNNSWLRYDEHKLLDAFQTQKAREVGTRLHEFASEAIKLQQKLQKSKKPLNKFVNDCIDRNMMSEMVLYYSQYCYGTADAIYFDSITLEIWDLKTGTRHKTTKKFLDQLCVYAALFCLEYKIDPYSITIKGRIYVDPEVIYYDIDANYIFEIMNKIILFNEILKENDQWTSD